VSTLYTARWRGREEEEGGESAIRGGRQRGKGGIGGSGDSDDKNRLRRSISERWRGNRKKKVEEDGERRRRKMEG